MQATDLSSLVTLSAEAGLYGRAKAVAEKFGLSLGGSPVKTPFELHLAAAGLELRQLGQEAPGPLCIDYCAGRADHRRRFGGGVNQTLARAAGIKKRPGLRLIDVTAGLGRDAYVLATLGCTVTLVERSPVFAALLDDALQRAVLNSETQAIVNRMHLVHADSRDYLSRLKPDLYPDVIYLDPMYPHREKSALVKKEMRYARALVGDDADAAELLAAALPIARYRVVVKRPAGAPSLAGPTPHTVITGKTTRYDIYMHTNGAQQTRD
jgi:16S rRNA (guanine1516-N2)-methyltransferase